MSLHNVAESDNFATNVQMPADGSDAVDASDFESSTIKPLVDRTRWLRNALDAVRVWLLGGTIAPAGDVTLDLTAGGIKYSSANALHHVEFDAASDVHLIPNRKTVGPLFAPGNSGRANRKAFRYAGPTSFSMNVLNYDSLLLTPSADLVVTLSAVAYELDDSFWVYNFSSTHTIEMKAPGGATIITVQPAVSSPAWAFFMFNGTTWDLLLASWGI